MTERDKWYHKNQKNENNLRLKLHDSFAYKIKLKKKIKKRECLCRNLDIPS